MEIIANELQTVLAGANVQFTDTVVPGKACTMHRPGSGLVSLRGLTDQCRARYKISFGGNIAVPTGGTVGAISLAIAIDGEAIAATTMTVTPAAVEEFFNVFGAVYLDIPRGCCSQISVRNVNTQAIEVQNANLIIERVA
jgi:hypothetical protein